MQVHVVITVYCLTPTTTNNNTHATHCQYFRFATWYLERVTIILYVHFIKDSLM